MAIKRITPENAFLGILNEFAERQKKVIMTDLHYVGERAVKEARQNHTYMDRTGNLTSSMGYVVYDGTNPITASAFDKVSGTESSEINGSEKGKDFATQLARNIKNPQKLVIVAGMDYAEAVQAKGYNVLQTAIILTKSLLKKLYPNTKFIEE